MPIIWLIGKLSSLVRDKGAEHQEPQGTQTKPSHEVAIEV